jgi:uncharacterized protein (DUF1015 family)
VPLIKPFAALRPGAEHAAQVAAPPYDVPGAEEARRLGASSQWSFIHVSRPEIDLPPELNPYDELVYERGADNLTRLCEAGVLRRDAAPCYYIYQLTAGAHTQTGLAAIASIDAYENARIRRHELTRPDKETDRTRHVDVVNAQTGPVFLTYRQRAGIDAKMAQLTEFPPEIDFNDGKVRHCLWTVRDQPHIASISRCFEEVESLYVADGHHRTAAAARVRATRREAFPSCTGEESFNYVLSVLFPHDQVRILSYNRVCKDLNGLSREDFLAALRARFELGTSAIPVQPETRGRFGLYLAGQWYRLTTRDADLPRGGPVERLDASLLNDRLLQPVLGVSDLRRDPRVAFVGGTRSIDALQERVDCGEMAVGFSLYPTAVEELLAVSDAGLLMPPKSTWFEPKLADGLLSHVLD